MPLQLLGFTIRGFGSSRQQQQSQQGGRNPVTIQTIGGSYNGPVTASAKNLDGSDGHQSFNSDKVDIVVITPQTVTTQSQTDPTDSDTAEIVQHQTTSYNVNQYDPVILGQQLGVSRENYTELINNIKEIDRRFGCMMMQRWFVLMFFFAFFGIGMNRLFEGFNQNENGPVEGSEGQTTTWNTTQAPDEDELDTSNLILGIILLFIGVTGMGTAIFLVCKVCKAQKRAYQTDAIEPFKEKVELGKGGGGKLGTVNGSTSKLVVKHTTGGEGEAAKTTISGPKGEYQVV